MKGIIYSILLLLCIGCSQNYQTQEEVNTLRVDITKATKLPAVTPSEVIDLNQGDQPVPGLIYEAKIYGDTIWGIDIGKARGVYAYDHSGKNLLTINTYGIGPGEMIDYSGFDIDGTQLYITDMAAKRIRVFDKYSGEYIRELEIQPYGWSMAAKREGIWYDRGNSSYYHGEGFNSKLLYVDLQGKEATSRYIPDELDNLDINTRGAFAKWGDTLHYYPTMEPAVYALTSDSAKLVYSIDFVNHWPDKEYFTNLKDLDIFGKVKRLTEDGYVFDLCFLENENWLHFNFNVDKVFYLYFYNKATEDSFIIKDPEERLYHPIAIKDNNIYISTDEDGIIEIYNINSLIK